MSEHIKPFKYIINKVGSYYHVRDSNGILKLSTSSFGTAINDEAFAGIGTSGIEEIKLVGVLTLDEVMLIPNHCLLNANGAKITSSISGGDSMIEAESSASYLLDIIIDGGIWDCNNNATEAVKFVNGENCVYNDHKIELRNMHIFDPTTRAIDINCIYQQRFNINNIDVTTAVHMANESIRLNASDSTMHGLNITEGSDGMCMVIRGAANEVSNFNINGGCILIDWHDNVLSNGWMDSNGAQNAIQLAGGGNVISNIHMRINGDGNTSNSAIYIWDASSPYSVNNVINGCYAGRSTGGSGTSRWSRGVAEGASATTDRNLVIGCNFYDCLAVSSFAGANSKIVMSWDYTSFVTHA